MNNTFSKTAVHSALVEAGVAVYEAAETYQAACQCVMEAITEARESLPAAQFEKWATAEFGTGGARKADGYVAGAWPTALREDGRLMQRSATKDDTRDAAANRVNTFVSDARAIVRACIDNPAFEFKENWRQTQTAARGKAPAGGTATKADKTATKPSAVAVITAEQGRAWVQSSPLDALDTLRRYLIERKDTIRAATVDAIAKQLAQEATEAEAKAKAEAAAKRGKKKAA